MRSVIRICGGGFCCLLLALGAIQWVARTSRSEAAPRLPADGVLRDHRDPDKTSHAPYPSPALQTFADPNAPAGSSDRVFLDPAKFDGTVFSVTVSLAGENHEPGSLKEYREVIGSRPRGRGRNLKSGVRVSKLPR